MNAKNELIDNKWIHDEIQSDLFPISPLLRQLLISIKASLFCECGGYPMKLQRKCFMKYKECVDSIRFPEFGATQKLPVSVSH